MPGSDGGALVLLTRRLLVSLATIAAALVTAWLLQADSSPWRSYFMSHDSAPAAWIAINMPSVFLGLVLSSNVHTPSFAGYLLGLVLQWGLAGFLLSLVIVRRPKARLATGGEGH